MPPKKIETEPKEKKWSPEKAIAGFYYTTVPKEGSKNGHLLLSGAGKQFQAHPDWIYNSTYHLVGSPAEIREFLTNQGFSRNEVEDSIKTSYTANNINSSAAYTEEVAAQKAYQTSKKKPAPGNMSLGELSNILQTSRLITNEKKATRSKKPADPNAAKPTRQGRVKPLSEKLSDLSDGHVLDVSSMTEHGAGVKSIARPSDKSKKVGISGLDIVSSNPETYYLAISMLGDAYSGFADAYRRMIMGESAAAAAEMPSVPAEVTAPVAAPGPRTIPNVAPKGRAVASGK